MNIVEIGQIILIVLVVFIGVAGMIKILFFDNKK